VKYEPINLNEKEQILDLNYIMISKEDAEIILDCVKNAIKVYEDDSENDLLCMDESDLEICKEFINSFKSIYKNIEKFIVKNNEGSLNFKINPNEIEALQNAFELYCIDMDKEVTDKGYIKALELYDKIKKINCEILNKTNPKYIKMLNNFENTSLK
jgi:hypothetical protein